MRLVLLCLLLPACARGPCEPQRFEDDPTAGPGEVRHGFSLGALDDLVATSRGMACLSCGTLLYFDGALQEESSTSVELRGRGRIGVTSEATIVLDEDYAPNSDFLEGTDRPPRFQMFAVPSSGDELWRNDFGDGEAWTGTSGPVGLNGPRRAVPDITTGPSVAIVHGRPLASVFDAERGGLMWTTTVQGGYALAADAGAGLFLAENSVDGAPAQATLRHLGASGMTIWTTTWNQAEPRGFGDIIFRGAGRTANDDLVVAGDFTTPSLDIGGHVLLSPPGPIGPNGVSFVAALDGHGATRWVTQVGTRDYRHGYIQIRSAAVVGDGAMVCGEYAGDSQLGLPATDGSINLFVARVDASGVIAAYPILGNSAFCNGIIASGDGSAVVVLISASGVESTAIRVGSRTFDSGPEQNYVLNLAL